MPDRALTRIRAVSSEGRLSNGLGLVRHYASNARIILIAKVDI